ncbi:MAG: hypothetical protein H6708_31640 [Kofleriaceae bacterium]|nr:hypothetical protein [Kofleriaceae bacterium]
MSSPRVNRSARDPRTTSRTAALVVLGGALALGCEHTPTPPPTSGSSAGASPTKPPTAPGPTAPTGPTSTAAGAAQPEDAGMPDSHDVSLEWTAQVDQDHLAVHYTIHNRSAAPIFVADRLITEHGGKGPVLVPDRCIVVDGDPGVIRLVRGVVPVTTTEFNRAPGVVEVAAGADHEGSARLEYPLRAYHNVQAGWPTLAADARSIVLEVAYIADAGTPADWADITVTNSKDKVHVPQLPYFFSHQHVLKGKPITLP